MSSYTLFVVSTPLITHPSPGNQNFLQVDAATDTQRYVIRRNASGTLLSSLVGGSGGAFAPTATLIAGQRYKVAGAVAPGSQACSLNGGVPGTNTAATLPTTPTTLRLGCGSASTELAESYLERVALIPSRIANTDLQGITQ
jgi:hypothetical protein